MLGPRAPERCGRAGPTALEGRWGVSRSAPPRQAGPVDDRWHRRSAAPARRPRRVAAKRFARRVHSGVGRPRCLAAPSARAAGGGAERSDILPPLASRPFI